MKKKKMFGLGTVIAVFVAVIMMSSAIVVPAVNKEAAEVNYTVEQQTDGGDLENLIYIKALEYISNAEFLEKLEWFEDTVNAEIEKLPVEYQQLVIDFFDIEETFSLGRMNQNLLMIRPPLGDDSIMDTIQYMINPPDNYNHFYSSQYERTKIFMNMIYDGEEGIRRPVSLEDDPIFPVVEVICFCLAVISTIWAAPLTFALGNLGLAVANFITCIFFSVLWMPMSIYVAGMTAIIEDDELYYELKELVQSVGLAGLLILGIPVILTHILATGDFNNGMKYVLERILLFSWNPTVTGDALPSVSYVTSSPTARKGEIVKFHSHVTDIDSVCYEGSCSPRDYLQVGIDWDNDKFVDEWACLEEPSGEGGYGYAQFVVSHIFNEPGVYRVNFVARELWGLRGESWNTVDIVIITPRSRTLFDTLFMGVLERFPMLRHILRL